MSDPRETAQRLLARAGDAAATEAEAASCATKAARLFREHGLRLLGPDDERRLTCIMCQPADKGYGTCPLCGLICRGPGHACSDPEPGTLCRVHATWAVNRPPRLPPPPPVPVTGFGPGFGPGMPFFGGGGVLFGQDLSQEVESLRLQLAAARHKIATLEAEVERLRAPKLVPQSDLDPSRTHVGFLELPVRVERILRHAGLDPVSEILRLSVSDLLKVPGLGRRSVREIRRALRMKMNTDLGGPP